MSPPPIPPLVCAHCGAPGVDLPDRSMTLCPTCQGPDWDGVYWQTLACEGCALPAGLGHTPGCRGRCLITRRESRQRMLAQLHRTNPGGHAAERDRLRAAGCPICRDDTVPPAPVQPPLFMRQLRRLRRLWRVVVV